MFTGFNFLWVLPKADLNIKTKCQKNANAVSWAFALKMIEWQINLLTSKMDMGIDSAHIHDQYRSLGSLS